MMLIKLIAFYMCLVPWTLQSAFMFIILLSIELWGLERLPSFHRWGILSLGVSWWLTDSVLGGGFMLYAKLTRLRIRKELFVCVSGVATLQAYQHWSCIFIDFQLRWFWPPEDLGSVWRNFWSSELGMCYWHLVGRVPGMLLNTSAQDSTHNKVLPSPKSR